MGEGRGFENSAARMLRPLGNPLENPKFDRAASIFAIAAGIPFQAVFDFSNRDLIRRTRQLITPSRTTDADQKPTLAQCSEHLLEIALRHAMTTADLTGLQPLAACVGGSELDQGHQSILGLGRKH